ncbi:flavin reductase family protein [Planococcus shenhongbingii]|uniref:Flavin reductase family protein n=1 Tax=Planococcus shenhongbingii TaxID=3058398 RepID=A0ABT8NCI3_9BACL|nr:flavin reductase family protein [Planococcus sp. N017]MDN7245596.1 flavin reductase family protein [Planococcus sp. N017]
MLNEDNQRLFKEAMGNYPTGVTVVTTTNREGDPVGITVNSFASVSLDPLIILWSIDRKASSIDTFTKSGKFIVHLLANDQQELVKLFSSKNVDRFSKIKWGFSDNQLPVLEGAFAVLECETVQTVEAGDHTILIGAVTNIRTEKKDPLLYHRRHIGAIPSEFYERM